MEPSTQSSKNQQTPWSSCPSIPCSPPHQNPSPFAVAGTISDYWYYYPEDGWGKWPSLARLPQFYEMKICLAESLGREKKATRKNKQTNKTETKQNRKGCLGKSQMLPCHISAHTAEWLQDICLAGGSLFSFFYLLFLWWHKPWEVKDSFIMGFSE